MTSFRTRLTLRWTLAFGLVLALAHAAVYLGSRAVARRDLDAQVRTLAATELASAVDEWVGVHLHAFPVDVLGRREYADKLVQLVDAGGRIVAQPPGLAASAAVLPRGVLDAALAGEPPVVDVAPGGRRARVTALGFTHDGARYVMVAGLYADRLDASLEQLAWLLAGVWGVALVLTAGIGAALASRALEPVDRITARAAAIARGDLGARLDPPAVDDEIGRMTRLLNEMLDRLHAVIDANRRFAADASHELRSPLTAIAGEVDVALKRERDPAEYRETLRLVRARLRELIELADGLTVLVRAEETGREGLVEEVPLAAVLDAAVARQAPAAAARRVRVDVERPDGLVAYGDRRLVARAVDNVLANAVQYDREGGRVTVRAGCEEAAPAAWETGTVWIRVADTGPGIPEAQWERVFERFHRLEPSRSRRTGGSGLGLAIARAALALCGGSVRIVASSPAGTTVELRLPGAARGDDALAAGAAS